MPARQPSFSPKFSERLVQFGATEGERNEIKFEVRRLVQAPETGTPILFLAEKLFVNTVGRFSLYYTYSDDSLDVLTIELK